MPLGCSWTNLNGAQIDIYGTWIDNLYLICFSAEVTEVNLILYNNMLVQQAFAITSQNPELLEVLQMPLKVTEDQDPTGEPPEPNPVMKAAIKPVDKREGTIPAPIPSEREYSSHVSLALGLANQEVYSRLLRYLQSEAKLDMIPEEVNENCLFSNIRRAVDCPLEYQTIHLKRQLTMMMVNHHAFLFPLLKAILTTTYGLPHMPKEEYQQKYEEGTLTQDEVDDHNTPGPFSYLGYMKALLVEGFWGDELCLALISMVWQVGITVVKGETFHQIKFCHSNLLKDADLALIHCQG